GLKDDEVVVGRQRLAGKRAKDKSAKQKPEKRSSAEGNPHAKASSIVAFGQAWPSAEPSKVNACARIEEVEAVQRHRLMVKTAVDQIELGRIEVLIHPKEMHARFLQLLIGGNGPSIYLGADDLEGAIYASAGKCSGGIDQAVGWNRPESGDRVVVKDN